MKLKQPLVTRTTYTQDDTTCSPFLLRGWRKSPPCIQHNITLGILIFTALHHCDATKRAFAENLPLKAVSSLWRIYNQQHAQHWISLYPTPEHQQLLQNHIVSPLHSPTAVWECVPEGYGLQELGRFFTGYKSQANPQIPSNPVRYFTSSPSQAIAELLLQNFSHVLED